jgi:hypothetical protein
MARTRFELSQLERVLLAFYNTVPVAVRSEVGQRLFDAWVHPLPADKLANEQRRKVAWERFAIGKFGVVSFDDMVAGEAGEQREREVRL